MHFENMQSDGYIPGYLLIASPSMQDPRFKKTVLFISAHDKDGAMALAINRPLPEFSFQNMVNELDLEIGVTPPPIKVLAGGPNETVRGFVLHTNDYRQDDTLVVTEEFSITATLDIIEALATGVNQPKQYHMILGYAGWDTNQLEQELLDNGWLVSKATLDLIFHTPFHEIWEKSLSQLGVQPSNLSSFVGHA